MENKPLARQLGANVRRLRKERGLNLAEVSARMDALGTSLSLNGLSKVELGNRGLDLDEMVAVARALEVPPLLLVFPLGQERTVEPFPGRNVDTWAAAKWFTGEGPFPGSNEDIEDFPTAYFREQDRLIVEWHRTRQGLAEARALVGEERGRPDREEIRQQEARWLEDALRSVEKQLRLYRAITRRDGVDLGELPPELAHVDRAVDGER